MFSNWFTFTVIRKYGKSDVIQITAMFDPFTMLFLEGSSEMQLFRHFSNNIFRNPQLMKCIKYEDHLFCESVQNFIYILKMQRKMEKKLFVFEIIASELAVLICLNKEKKKLRSAVNMFRNSPKILPITNREFFQPNYLHINP